MGARPRGGRRALKVVFLTTRLPAPPWRGDQVRAFHLLRVLARDHDITCVALPLRPPGADAVAATTALGVRLEVIPLGLAAAVPALACAAVGDPAPFQVLLHRRARARRRVAALVAAGVDVVHAQLLRTVEYLPGAGGPPAVVDLIDAASLNVRRRAERDHGATALLARWEGARAARAERDVVERAAATFVVSAVDRAAIGGDARLEVVPNGVDVAAFPFRWPPPAPRVLFAGNLGYFPNVDAAEWLARDVFPRIRAAEPRAELRLVGARPARRVRRLAGTAITVAGPVPAMAPEIAAAAVTVIPMRAGSGLQNKVLEAMAVGTPVVATARAVAALDVVPGEHLLVAEDAAGLAAGAVSLLRDPARAERMARGARALVEARYRWETAAARIAATWARVARPSGENVRARETD